jgi:hypothetical protein
MRLCSSLLAGVMFAIACVAVGDSADAAIIVSDFEAVAPIPSGLTGTPTDFNGNGVLFSGSGNGIQNNGGLGAPFGNNSLINVAGDITMSAATNFNFVRLDVYSNSLVGGTLKVNGIDFGFGNGHTSIAVGLLNLSGAIISSSVGFTALDNIEIDTLAAAAVPEPASAAFLGLGSLALVVRRLRRRSSVVA